MSLIDRQFAGEEDVVRLREYLAGMVTLHGQRFFLHTGDFLWRLVFQDDWLQRARNEIRIWETSDGKVAGFCWFSAPNWVDVQVDPIHSNDGKLEAEMIAWASQQASTQANPAPLEMHVDAFDGDERKLGVLRSLGFNPDGPQQYTYYAQSLAGRPHPPPVPDGAAVRAVAGDTDIADRVAIHREVWHPSRLTAELYQEVRRAPGYRPDLDLVAVAPDGRFAAYTICWYDPVNRIGEFEPVGTRAEYRRQGYGRAVIAEGLRRLYGLGAAEAIVYSAAQNEASNALYQQCGFALVGRFLDLRLQARSKAAV